MKKVIKYENITLIKERNIDDIGAVFFYQDKIYRYIYIDKEDYIRKMFTLWFIAEAISLWLLIDTKISDYVLEKEWKNMLLLEHRKIETISYPYERSFDMLKDAALCILKINKIANKYWYELKDWHPYNVLFDWTKPLYIDVWSFQLKEWKKSRLAFHEFYQTLYLPIKIISQWYDKIGNSCLIWIAKPFSDYEVMIWKYPILKILPIKLAMPLSMIIRHIWNIYSYSDELITRRVWWIKARILILYKKYLWKFFEKSYIKYIKRIKNIDKKRIKTDWSFYHDDFNKISTSYRFNSIIKEIGNLDWIKTISDLAWNQWSLFMVMKKKHKDIYEKINKIFVLDYDVEAINQWYLNFKKTNDTKITFLQQNIVNNYYNNYGDVVTKRIKSDCVLVLAVVHHLIITQWYSWDFVFNKIYDVTNKYVFIEFMPLGLWIKWDPEIIYEKWIYTKSLFEKSFNLFFSTKKILKLEENRILYIGEKKKTYNKDWL